MILQEAFVEENRVNVFFNAYIPLTGQDQDAEPIANDRFIIVCDGLGGDGSAKHIVGLNDETQKSAFIGSRLLSSICAEFFADNYDALLSKDKVKDSICNLKIRIKEKFTEHLSKYPRTEDSKGGMIFPTTLACAVYKEETDYIQATVIWSGDSRAYMLTESNWLQQLSKDDVVENFDACFGKDCRMSNCISQDDDFFINYACYKLPKKCVLFVCSDGCFDFTASPMHFEFKVLEALFKVNKFDSAMLNDSFENVFSEMMCGDDCTLSGVVFGYTADEFRNYIRNRISPLKALTTDFTNAEKIYERIVNEKKLEIRTLTSENRKLSQEIISQQKNVILSSFKEEISNKEESIKDKNLLNISLLLKTPYRPYADYLIELQEFSEKVKQNLKIIAESQTIYEKLKSLIDNAEREKRLKEKKERRTRNPIYNTMDQFISFVGSGMVSLPNSNQASIKKSECIMYIEELERLLYGIKQNIEMNTSPAISEQLANLANNIIRSLYEFNNIEVQDSYHDEKTKASILSEDELNKKVIPIVLKNGINQYRDYVDEQAYETLFSVYNEYKNVETRLSSINPIEKKEKTFDEKVKDFELVFLKNHLFKMTEYLVNFDGISSFVPALAQYQTNMDRLNTIQNNLNSEKDVQKQVWEKYKNNYEYYLKCSFSGEV